MYDEAFYGHCDYCRMEAGDLRWVQLRSYVYSRVEWQPASQMCGSCRGYLRGQYRYYKAGAAGTGRKSGGTRKVVMSLHPPPNGSGVQDPLPPQPARREQTPAPYPPCDCCGALVGVPCTHDKVICGECRRRYLRSPGW